MGQQSCPKFAELSSGVREPTVNFTWRSSLSQQKMPMDSESCWPDQHCCFALHKIWLTWLNIEFAKAFFLFEWMLFRSSVSFKFSCFGITQQCSFQRCIRFFVAVSLSDD